MTGLVPILSLRAPKTGLRKTSETSYRASRMPRFSSVRPMLSLCAPRPAAMLCAPKAVTNPAA